MPKLFSPVRRALFASALLALSSCAIPRRVPFDEAAFAGYGAAGSGVVEGDAFTVLRDASTMVPNHRATVKLLPLNSYTEEVVQTVFEAGKHLEPPDPRFLKYIRRVHPDDNGHFVFKHLPPGRYYVGCHVHWTYPDTSTDSDGNITDVEVGEDQWIYQKVSVKNGQTVKVDGWTQGR